MSTSFRVTLVEVVFSASTSGAAGAVMPVALVILPLMSQALQSMM